jgi:hypothetical protein
LWLLLAFLIVVILGLEKPQDGSPLSSGKGFRFKVRQTDSLLQVTLRSVTFVSPGDLLDTEVLPQPLESEPAF